MKSRILFDERVNDINEYFEFIETLINKRPTMSYSDTEQNYLKKITINITHILKSNAFLILYNLIEATVSNAIEDIHDEILNNNNLCVDLLCTNLTKIAFKNIDIKSIDKLDFNTTNASKIILTHWLSNHKNSINNNKNPLFAGNVDAKKIKEIAKKYGFSYFTDPIITRNGAYLLLIKNARNSLAHGEYSFLEKGRDTSIDDLTNFKNETINYLNKILDNIATYIETKQYLREQISLPI